MDTSSLFKVPSIISQDIALIMGYVDPPTPSNLPVPEPETCIQKTTKDEKEEGDDDISSSRHESEDEEVENVLLAGVAENDEEKTNAIVQKENNSPDSNSSDSDDSDSDSDSNDEDGKINEPVIKPRKPDPPELDLDEDGPPIPEDYVPTAHEIPLTSIPIPLLPDPATLPNEPLEMVGEIGTILTDTIIIRGGSGGGSSSGYQTAMEKRHAILDEGSLLLFDDRTPLGYVWETFGPTHLPHYIVRVPRRVVTPVTTHGPETGEDIPPEVVNPNALLDKATLSRPVYHLRSTSKFVFTQALIRLKGSDASNIHDEELAEHEQEFSDDEAEAAFKRANPKRKGSRAPSVSRSQRQHQHQRHESFAHPESNYTDDAGSLYGDSPYDIEGSSNSIFHSNVPAQQGQQYFSAHTVSTTAAASSVSAPLQNPEIQRALLNARLSRRRKGSIAGATHPDSAQMQAALQSSSSSSRSFSFEEYDPRMPRPPSPTSLAIAQATGQWSNGMPFVYDSNMNTVPMTTSYASPVSVSGGFHHAYHHAQSSTAAAYAGMVPGIVSPGMSSHSQSVPQPPYQALPSNTSTSGSFEGDDAQMKD